MRSRLPLALVLLTAGLLLGAGVLAHAAFLALFVLPLFVGALLTGGLSFHRLPAAAPYTERRRRRWMAWVLLASGSLGLEGAVISSSAQFGDQLLVEERRLAATAPGGIHQTPPLALYPRLWAETGSRNLPWMVVVALAWASLLGALTLTLRFHRGWALGLGLLIGAIPALVPLIVIGLDLPLTD
jgi:hypothetical protein